MLGNNYVTCDLCDSWLSITQTFFNKANCFCFSPRSSCASQSLRGPPWNGSFYWRDANFTWRSTILYSNLIVQSVSYSQFWQFDFNKCNHYLFFIAVLPAASWMNSSFFLHHLLLIVWESVINTILWHITGISQHSTIDQNSWFLPKFAAFCLTFYLGWVFWALHF